MAEALGHVSRQANVGGGQPVLGVDITIMDAPDAHHGAGILIAVVACLLAIWQFTGRDVLWRTVATCAVIAFGMMAFYVVNVLFDWPSD